MTKNKRLIIIAVCLSLLIPQQAVSKEYISLEYKDKPKYVQGEVIVKYKNNINSLKNKAKIAKKYSLKHKKNLSLDSAEVVEIPSNINTEEMIKKLKIEKDIELVQPNFIYCPKEISSDERSDELWGLENTGQLIQGSYGVAGIDLGIKKAWSITKGNNEVVVGVVDTGIDINHPELKDRIWVNKNEVPDNGIDDDSNGYVDDVNGWDFYNKDSTVYDEKDGDKHGTHVAGTIAASLNDMGVVGIAPNVKIMPLKFIGPFWGTTDAAIEAIEYAKKMGIKILNNSWGGSSYDMLLKTAIEQSGTLFVAAAGNEGLNNDVNPSYPVAFNSENLLSVAAIDNKGRLAYFSNFGVNSVDIAAPGLSILSTIPRPVEVGAAVQYQSEEYKTFVQGISLSDFTQKTQREYLMNKILSFFDISGNSSILLVADDESKEGDHYSAASIYKNTLESLGFHPSCYYVDVGGDGPDSSLLNSYQLVIWMTGDAYSNTLTESDKANLKNYLTDGKGLYLSGNSLSEELVDTEFANKYLHVNYLFNDNNRYSLEGVVSSGYDGQTFSLGSNVYSDMIETSNDLGKTILNYKGDLDYKNSYQYLHGTSMAAPHASGVAALLMSKGVDNPLILKEKILLGVQPLQGLYDKIASGGMVNAYNSLRYIKDFNNDKSINLLDLASLAKYYNMRLESENINEVYDLKEDGIIDIFDLVLLSKDMIGK